MKNKSRTLTLVQRKKKVSHLTKTIEVVDALNLFMYFSSFLLSGTVFSSKLFGIQSIGRFPLKQNASLFYC